MSLELAEITACFALKTYLKELLERFGCLMNKSVFDSSQSGSLDAARDEIKLCDSVFVFVPVL